MAASFKKGQEVKLIVTAPQGEIQELSVNQDGDILYLVSWVDTEGTTQSRWFAEDTLTSV